MNELLEVFKDRVLPFDTNAARHYADLAMTARNGGRGFPRPDGYIAAVAASRGFIVASRDEAAGVAVINPWKDTQGQGRHRGRAQHDRSPGLSGS